MSRKRSTAIYAAAVPITAWCERSCARLAKWRRNEPARSALIRIAGQPFGQSTAVVLAEILAARRSDGLAGKGGDRTRHRHGAGADRGRRTRRRYFACAHGAGLDRNKPQ